MLLNELRPPKGATHKKKRVGRGESSGHGKTSGRGHKGQKARAGGFHKTGFEGGQMPLQRRLPKRGFCPFNRQTYHVVNVEALNRFQAGSEINEEMLREKGMIKRVRDGLKILGDGLLEVSLVVKADRFSRMAKEKIEKAGGQALLIKGGD